MIVGAFTDIPTLSKIALPKKRASRLSNMMEEIPTTRGRVRDSIELYSCRNGTTLFDFACSRLQVDEGGGFTVCARFA